MPDWEDLSDFFDLDDFAQSAEVMKDGAPAGQITGIFETPRGQSGLGDFEHPEQKPRFICTEAQAGAIERYDALRIAGVLYDVLEPPEHEGTGLAFIMLGQPVVRYR